MITLHTWSTPNGRKPLILLEELQVPYTIVPVDLGQREQFEPAFLAISPNNKIPALVDDEAVGGPLTMFESGAILTYLAEKHGRLLPPAGAERYRVLTWLHWQIGGVGPMFGQLGFFAKQDDAFAMGHFAKEAERLLGVLDKQLSAGPYLAGAGYSIADIAVYPWIVAATERLGPQLGATVAGKAALQRWLKLVGERPAVRKAMAWSAG